MGGHQHVRRRLSIMKSASTLFLFLACFVYIAYARPSVVPEISSLVTSMTGPELADSSRDGAIPTAATPGLRRTGYTRRYPSSCVTECVNHWSARVIACQADKKAQVTARDVRVTQLTTQLREKTSQWTEKKNALSRLENECKDLNQVMEENAALRLQVSTLIQTGRDNKL